MSKAHTKKQFDKKKWREKTYSKKFKLQQWEERRKKGVIRDYIKELKKNKAENLSIHTTPLRTDADGCASTSKGKLSAYRLAKVEFERKKEEKRKRREEAERRKQEREEALEKYKRKKMERYRKLSKKTKKGQPVMKDRIEMLLEKIQSDCNS